MVTEYETVEKVHSWQYVPINAEGAYNVIGYYGKEWRTTTTHIPYSYTRETWEIRRYDYNLEPARAPSFWEGLIWNIINNL